MITFFKTVIYTPLYNSLILILNIDWVDAGIAAVILTILVKMVLYPLTKKTTITQVRMKEKEKDLALIKEKYKNNQEQALKIMEFYKENNINPFSGIFSIFIQIPIIYSLFYIFSRSGLPTIDTTILYSFVNAPVEVSMQFLGIIDISQKSLLLAALAAASTFWQTHLSTKSITPSVNKNVESKDDFASMMTKQMKYTMPLVVFFVSWQTSGVLALYWFVSNLVGIAQEMYIKRKMFTLQS